MHAGTHIDAPKHILQTDKYISDYPIERFVGNAILLDVRGESIIEVKDEYYRSIKENDIVLLFTGHDKIYGTENYYTDHPVVSEELADLLVKKKIKILGLMHHHLIKILIMFIKITWKWYFYIGKFNEFERAII